MLKCLKQNLDVHIAELNLSRKSDNTKIRTIDYGRDADELAITGYTWLDHEIQARYHCCPACERYSVRITGFDNAFSLTYPPYTGMVLPDYIPEAIRTDYLEACSILDKSPRAAATLAPPLLARNDSGLLGESMTEAWRKENGKDSR